MGSKKDRWPRGIVKGEFVDRLEKLPLWNKTTHFSLSTDLLSLASGRSLDQNLLDKMSFLINRESNHSEPIRCGEPGVFRFGKYHCLAYACGTLQVPGITMVCLQGTENPVDMANSSRTCWSAVWSDNKFQKKYLMRFHYFLNPIALCVAFLHFLLSSCRSSPLPEWGLVLVTMVVFLGLILKFKVSPKWMRKIVYRFHTSLAAFSAVILVLVVGHLLVD